MGEGLPFNSERILPIALQSRTSYLSILFFSFAFAFAFSVSFCVELYAIMESQGPTVNSVAIVFAVISFIAVVLRLWARISIVRSVGADDCK